MWLVGGHNVPTDFYDIKGGAKFANRSLRKLQLKLGLGHLG